MHVYLVILYTVYTFLVTKALAHDVRAAVGLNIFLQVIVKHS